MIVADCGYGRNVSFSLALEEHGWSYVMAVETKEIARPAGAEPYLPPYQRLGRPTSSRYREPTRPLLRLRHCHLAPGQQRTDDLTLAMLEVRPSGKEATRAFQEHAD